MLWIKADSGTLVPGQLTKSVRLYLVGGVSDGHQHLLQSRLESAADAHQIFLVLQLCPRPQQQAFHHLLGHLQTLISLRLPGPQTHIVCAGVAALETFCRVTWEEQRSRNISHTKPDVYYTVNRFSTEVHSHILWLIDLLELLWEACRWVFFYLYVKL